MKKLILVGLCMIFLVGIVVGWDIDDMVYDEVSFLVSQDASPSSIFFKPDGTYFYISGSSNTVHQYPLSSAWDLSTASFVNDEYDTSSQTVTSDTGVFFKPDGIEMYVLSYGDYIVYQYTLGTAWNVTTAIFNDMNYTLNAQDATISGIFFKPDGTKMYITGDTNNAIYQYTLDTAWNISTTSYDIVSYDVTGETSDLGEIYINATGNRFYLVSWGDDLIYQYTLGTPWVINTATYDELNYNASDEDTSPQGIYFKPDGTKGYIVGTQRDTVYQYTLEAPPPPTPPQLNITSISKTSKLTINKGGMLTISK